MLFYLCTLYRYSEEPECVVGKSGKAILLPTRKVSLLSTIGSYPLASFSFWKYNFMSSYRECLAPIMFLSILQRVASSTA